MAIRINLKKAERVILPEDDYPVRIDRAEFRPAGKGGQGGPTCHLELLTENTGTPEHDGIRLYRDQSLQEQSWWSMLEILKAAFGEVEGDVEGDFEFEPSDLEGSTVGVHVSTDVEYDGRPRNKVDSFFPVDEVGAEEEGTEESATEGTSAEEGVEEEAGTPA